MQILRGRLIGYLNWLFICNWQYIFISSIPDTKHCRYMFSCFYVILLLIAFLWYQRKIIITILTILVLMILFIQLVQQFTFPIAPFGVDIQAEAADNVIEIRNGLFRFRIETVCFAMLIVFFIGNNY